MKPTERGCFVISLDTEFAWGTFDISGFSTEDYEGTREVITELLTLFDKYEIPATWAIVTHLLTDCRNDDTEHELLCDDFHGRGAEWYSSLPCQTAMPERSWYEPEIVTWIRDAAVDHEIGSHTHTHPVLQTQCGGLARADLEASISAAEAVGESPRSLVYPRNRIDHRHIVDDVGFDVIRGKNAGRYESSLLPAAVRKSVRFVDEALTKTPPTVVPSMRSGLVEIPGSQLFRPYHGGWQFTPTHSQRDRAVAGLNRAADSSEIFHLWFHPFNLASEPAKLLSEIEGILKHAASLRKRDEIDILTMIDIADDYRDGRWASSQ